MAAQSAMMSRPSEPRRRVPPIGDLDDRQGRLGAERFGLELAAAGLTRPMVLTVDFAVRADAPTGGILPGGDGSATRGAFRMATVSEHGLRLHP
jgi:hypothetical protein